MVCGESERRAVRAVIPWDVKKLLVSQLYLLNLEVLKDRLSHSGHTVANECHLKDKAVRLEKWLCG